MSRGPRPSMRTWSRRTRARTSFLVTDRNAAESSFSRPSNWGPTAATTWSRMRSRASSRSDLPAIRSASATWSPAAWDDRRVRVRLVLEEDRELGDRLGRDGGDLVLGPAQLADGRLGGLQPAGHDLLGRLRRAAGDQRDRVLGRLGLDHHDRDVAVGQDPAGDDHVEGGPLELLVGREGDPGAVDVRHPGGPDRAGERQAGQLGGQRRGVDGDHVVRVRTGRARARSRRPGPRCAGP